MTATSIPANVDAAGATDLMKERARIIDVRSPAEFESIHIPGSYNVPLDLLSEHRHELRQSVKDPIILVCGTGVRAEHAESALRQAGLEQITVLQGGINAWEAEGREVVRGEQKWPIERQVRGVAGSLVLTGALGGLLFWRPLTYISVFVGSGLLFSAVSNTCGMARLLEKLPYNQGAGCDINHVVRQLSTRNEN